MRFSKQNSVIRIKSNILTLPNFWAGYATEWQYMLALPCMCLKCKKVTAQRLEAQGLLTQSLWPRPER